jgi:DNA (cytosine-5)-methyltransferase 1
LENTQEIMSNMISLFSGGGGMLSGFIEAGYNCILSTDIMPESKPTIDKNNLSEIHIEKDITHFRRSEVLDIVKSREVDVLIGGPPCKGFTNMGDKLANDPRNNLVGSYLNFVRWTKPKVVLMENVPGLKNKYDGKFYNSVVNGLSEEGFDVYSKILDSSNFGVPQKRKRIFIIGTKCDWDYNFPMENNANFKNLIARKNVGEAIMDLVNSKSAINHQALNHSDKVIRRYEHIPEGGKLPPPEELPIDIRRKNFGNTYQRLDRKKPSTTMVPGNNAFPVHPTLNRSLTPREAARLQSFSDDHEFFGSRKMQCKLVGHAVPPLLAAVLANSIANHLLGGDDKTLRIDELVTRRGEYLGNKKSEGKKTFIDLFCGSGGFARGFIDAGFECVATSDFDTFVSDAHRTNFSEIPHICGDLQESTTKQEIYKIADREKENSGDIELIVGGPPCQGFSMAGKRRLRDYNQDVENDSRNDLMIDFLEVVRHIGPKWVIIENVPGITSLNDGLYIEFLLTELDEIGYHTDRDNWRILNAADYGVPQKRQRFVLITYRKDLPDYVIPWPKKKYYAEPRSHQNKHRTVGDVISDLIDESTYGEIDGHNPPKHHPVVSERFSYVSPGERMDPAKIPERLRMGVKTKKPISRFNHVFFRLDLSKPSSTMVPGHNAFPIHPVLNRTLTIREVARIQTFPDEHIFVGPIINRGKQVGNAFPPLLASIIGNRLLRVVNNKWTKDTITDSAKYSMIDFNQ